MMNPATNLPNTATVTKVTYLLMAVMLAVILSEHLLPALLAGLLIHELVYLIAPHVMQGVGIKHRAAKVAVVSFLTVIVLTLLAAFLAVLIYYFRTGDESLPALLNKMAEILDSSRKAMPAWLAQKIPPDIESLKIHVTEWLRTHAGEFSLITKPLRTLAHILIGMLIGAMVSLYEAKADSESGVFTRALRARIATLALSFRQVVFAQVRIAAINTAFTAIYLMIILPIAGVKLPFMVMMVVLTFIFGLIPVIGNIMSNTVIVIVGLNHSIWVAGGSLAFLIIIHKFEYFLNAKIIGSRIQTRAFEILISMLLLETIFGVAGVIAAPIYYAYIKKELKLAGWI